MGRIRSVKPELFVHEELFEAEKQTGLPLRVAFIGLFTCADREGRFKWRPRTLKLAVLPHDELDFSRVLDALLTRGFLVKYASETGEEIGLIPTFTRHQVINNRETASDLPPPPANPCQTVDLTRDPTREPRVDDASPTRTQGKGKEGKGESTRGARELSFDPKSALQILGVEANVARDWLEIRKAKKAPLTETALASIEREAVKAGISVNAAVSICCERNWQGFKAEWMNGGSQFNGRANGHSDNPFE